MDATLCLIKNQSEPGLYLTKWYEIRLGTIHLIQFRSDAFVPEEVEEKLEKLHLQNLPYNDLTQKICDLLKPYDKEIVRQATQYLDNFDPYKQEEFSFNGPDSHFQVIKRNGIRMDLIEKRPAMKRTKFTRTKFTT